MSKHLEFIQSLEGEDQFYLILGATTVLAKVVVVTGDMITLNVYNDDGSARKVTMHYSNVIIASS